MRSLLFSAALMALLAGTAAIAKADLVVFEEWNFTDPHSVHFVDITTLDHELLTLKENSPDDQTTRVYAIPYLIVGPNPFTLSSLKPVNRSGDQDTSESWDHQILPGSSGGGLGSLAKWEDAYLFNHSDPWGGGTGTLGLALDPTPFGLDPSVAAEPGGILAVVLLVAAAGLLALFARRRGLISF